VFAYPRDVGRDGSFFLLVKKDQGCRFGRAMAVGCPWRDGPGNGSVDPCLYKPRVQSSSCLALVGATSPGLSLFALSP
jgi:hypothetical protein